MSQLERAMHIAATGLTFRIAESSKLFPPRDIANAFFACGYDDLPAEQVLEWEPFRLAEDEYRALLEWWLTKHPGALVNRLGVADPDFSRWFGAAVDERPPRRRR
jgi:hypothetical protein